MSEYEFHPEAFADLDDVRAYIAADNPDAADRVITEIFDRIRRILALFHGSRNPRVMAAILRGRE